YGLQTVQQGDEWDILTPHELADVKWMALDNTNPGDPKDDDWHGSGERPVLPDYIAPKGLMEGHPGVNPDLYNVNPFYPSPSDADAFYLISKENIEGTYRYTEYFSYDYTSNQ